MMCRCVSCTVSAARVALARPMQLLRVGKVRMAVVVLEGLLRSARHQPARTKTPPRARKAEGRA
jgi:hypothetical protein